MTNQTLESHLYNYQDKVVISCSLSTDDSKLMESFSANSTKFVDFVELQNTFCCILQVISLGLQVLTTHCSVCVPPTEATYC